MAGLYIHIPFCASKCGYCDFVSYAGRQDRMRDYVDAVVREAKLYQGLEVDTVFLGGGTPAQLPLGEMTRLMDGVQKSIAISDGAEWTVEVNPNSLTKEKAEEYVRLGVNRVSVGLQAVQPELLARIGRTHSFEDFLNCLALLRGAGISNVNVDLMYSLPGQTVEDVKKSAKMVAALNLQHISAYALKLEPGTPLYGQPQPDEETDRLMFYALKEILEEAGFCRYEISNFALPGRECRHNLKYWRVEEYVGLGVSAHSYLGGDRYANIDDLERYIRAIHKKGKAEVSRETIHDGLFEAVLLRTRLKEGIALSLLPSSNALARSMERLKEAGCCVIEEDCLRLTDRGMDLQNSVVAELAQHL